MSSITFTVSPAALREAQDIAQAAALAAFGGNPEDPDFVGRDDISEADQVVEASVGAGLENAREVFDALVAESRESFDEIVAAALESPLAALLGATEASIREDLERDATQAAASRLGDITLIALATELTHPVAL
jgi:hypothetical protein